jgi:NhaA family Na+:H+ antiporter
MADHDRSDIKNPQNRNPPGTSTPAQRRVKRILAPVERFLAIEAASGIVLMTAALVALVWANSPWRAAYEGLWHIPIGIRAGSFALERELHFWINDGLMTIFFFVVGLEIRREIHLGELSELRKATLPLAAAFGGMLAPALIFLALNVGRESVVGWAVPTATDIAFAVGALALLSKRVAPAMRVLLLALAVIDDVGAIVVIALFYSAEISATGFAVVAIGVLLILALQSLGIRSPVPYILPGIAVWAGMYISGIHPTLAGVIVGMMTPVTPRPGEAISPVERLEHLLHGWVAFVIMPVFAFANAGVTVGALSISGDGLRVFLGIAIGLTVGKPVGILALSWIAVRFGLAALPHAVGWRQVSVVGIVGGIGFTMSLFIAQLAFVQGPLLEIAKLAVLTGSAVAAIMSLVAGHGFQREARWR